MLLCWVDLNPGACLWLDLVATLWAVNITGVRSLSYPRPFSPARLPSKFNTSVMKGAAALRCWRGLLVSTQYTEPLKLHTHLRNIEGKSITIIERKVTWMTDGAGDIFNCHYWIVVWSERRCSFSLSNRHCRCQRHYNGTIASSMSKVAFASNPLFRLFTINGQCQNSEYLDR